MSFRSIPKTDGNAELVAFLQTLRDDHDRLDAHVRRVTNGHQAFGSTIVIGGVELIVADGPTVGSKTLTFRNPETGTTQEFAL